MRMEEGLDTGPYCVVESVAVDDKTASQLTDELAGVGAHALLSALRLIESGTCVWKPQAEKDATYAEKLTKPEVALAPGLRTDDALRRVRAAGSSAPARARVADKNVTVVSAERGLEAVDEGGVLLTKRGVALGTSDGAVLVTRIKPDGKQEMHASDWGRGLRLDAGATWEHP
jgi:methionyl-tRNA formyltransferase